VAIAAGQRVEDVDRARERHREVNAAARNVEIETVGNRHHADQDIALGDAEAKHRE